MLSQYQAFATSHVAPFAIGAVGAFLIYFMASKAAARAQRMRTSAHGIWLLAAAVYPVLVAPFSISSPFVWLLPFWILMVIFVVSLIYGVAAFEGSRWVHLFQVVEAPCALLILLIGTMTIGHDGP
jgi:hypothetical protein